MNLINKDKFNFFGPVIAANNLSRHHEDGVDNWNIWLKMANNCSVTLRQLLLDEPDYISWKYLKTALAELGIKLPNRKDLKCYFYTHEATYYTFITMV